MTEGRRSPYGPEDGTRFDKFGDWADSDRPVRKAMLRRIESGYICGYPSPDTGRPCYGTPMGPGEYCRKHDKLKQNRQIAQVAQADIAPPSKASAGNVLLNVLAESLSSYDARRIGDLLTYGPCTLDDLVALNRLRIIDLEQRYRDRLITLDRYGAELKTLTLLAVKLADANGRLALNTALAERVAVVDEPAYDPLAEIEAERKAMAAQAITVSTEGKGE